MTVQSRRLALLALCAFTVTSDGTLVVGLLRQMAHSLGVSPAAAGQLVTSFAIVYAVGAPLIIRATRRAAPRGLLTGALVMFSLANTGAAAASSFTALLCARVVAAACAGTVMPLAASVAARIVPPGRRGRALAVVVAGASAGTAIGVPSGTWVGDLFGWRTPFIALAISTAILALAAWAALSSQPASTLSSARLRVHREVVVTLVTTLLWATGSFTFFTYVAVILNAAARTGPTGVAVMLLVFGASGLVGAALAGRAADTRGASTALKGALALVVVSLVGFGVATRISGETGLVVSTIAIVLYGVGTWAVTPPQQQRLVRFGGNERLLLSLNSSALYAGVAAGSALGGLVLTSTGHVFLVCFVGAGISSVALALTVAGDAFAPRRPANSNAI